MESDRSIPISGRPPLTPTPESWIKRIKGWVVTRVTGTLGETPGGLYDLSPEVRHSPPPSVPSLWTSPVTFPELSTCRDSRLGPRRR